MPRRRPCSCNTRRTNIRSCGRLRRRPRNWNRSSWTLVSARASSGRVKFGLTGGKGAGQARMSTQLLIAALVQGSLYALIALGLNLVYGTMRLLNVAHGEFVMIGAYVAFWGITLFDTSPIIAIFIAIPLTMAIGIAFYFGIFKRAMRSREFTERIEAN